MTDIEIKVKHLEMIQGVINRMASNSFKMKGWSITIIIAFYAFIFSKDGSILWYVFLLPLLPSFCLCILDAYYLRLERLFSKIHNKVAKILCEETKEYKPFSMDFRKFEKDVPSTLCLVFTKSLKITNII